MKERIGVYICHCGGNISDYVDVEQISKMLQSEDGVVISKDVMFACADSNQKEMINDIKEKNLDSIVVASCSPKLHLHTFRNVATRAGINPFNYVQVNIREQCSWAHSDKTEEATFKAVGLIRAGIKRVTQSEALENIEIAAKKASLVIGAGVAGMRAAVALAKSGNEVYLVEKETSVGGRVLQAGDLFMSDINGKQLVDRLYNEVKSLPNITLFTGAEIEKVSGSVGNFNATVNIKSDKELSILNLSVGAILTCTGFDNYQPADGEFGYKNNPSVVTLPEFKDMLEKSDINSAKRIAFIYCVGNRQKKGENKYCSRVCCTAAISTSLKVKEKFSDVKLFHYFRDIRTYGKQEVLYERSSKQGDIYIRFDEKEPPVIETINNKTIIRAKDHLTSKKEFSLEVDLVVLVTGMVSRADSQQLAEKLKIPVGNERFFNEIHPKLKPVETVIKGIFIGGACQGPKNISESVQSSLSGVAKINALLCKGTISLDPIIASVNLDACSWCNKCAEVCEYDAITEISSNGKSIASVNKSTCIGCGICAPVCPSDAINLAQYTNLEIEGMIDGFTQKVNFLAKDKAIVQDDNEPKTSLKEFPQLWKQISDVIALKPKTIPQIAAELKLDSHLVTYNIMTMNKYNLVAAAGMDDAEAYYFYKNLN